MSQGSDWPKPPPPPAPPSVTDSSTAAPYRAPSRQASPFWPLSLPGGAFPFDLLTQEEPLQDTDFFCPSLEYLWRTLSDDDHRPAAWDPHESASGAAAFPRLFEPIPPKNTGTLASSVLATGILRSYPSMMERRETFPLFIHPRCYGDEGDNWRLPSTLVNTMSISHMFAQRTPESRSFIWRSIRAEQQRILDQVKSSPTGIFHNLPL